MKIALIGPPEHPRVRRLAAAFETTRLRSAEVVHIFAPRLAPGPTLLARAVVLTPLFDPVPLPWWARGFHRMLLPSQAEARRWTAHVPLGKIVVVETEDFVVEAAAVRAIYTETVSMRRGRR